MKLGEFNLSEEIYIDANIFIYLILENEIYLSSCRDFLEKVEKGEINAVISPLVIDEICFKIIVEKLKSYLGTKSNSVILQKLDSEPNLLNKAKPELMMLLFVLENYKGLKIVSLPSSVGIDIFGKMANHNLLPRDAIHLSIMEHYGVRNIASNDSDFERIKKIRLYKP